MRADSDLHVHTTASDGTDSPEEVVAQAARIGLACLAITDHDTLEGIEPALQAGKRFNVEVIPGIELSTEYHRQETHILGYMIDTQDRFLNEKLAFFRQTRMARTAAMVDHLRRMGMDIEMDRVVAIADAGSVGRPHVARALLEKGLVKSVGDAFDNYIGHDKPAYVPRYKYPAFQAVKMIRAAGGIAVLAHPGLSLDKQRILDLIQEGLQGIEVYHPSHESNVSQYYLEICHSYGLVATGGSDYHGKDRVENHLGSRTVSSEVVERIKDMAGMRSK